MCNEGDILHRGVSMTKEGRVERAAGWSNQREEKPVAKLQPATCVISQICGDKTPDENDRSDLISKYAE